MVGVGDKVGVGGKWAAGGIFCLPIHMSVCGTYESKKCYVVIGPDKPRGPKRCFTHTGVYRRPIPSI